MSAQVAARAVPHGARTAAPPARTSADPVFELYAEAESRRAAGAPIINATLGILCDDARRVLVLPSAARALQRVATTAQMMYAPLRGDLRFLDAVLDDCLAGAPELKHQAVCQAAPGGIGALHLTLTTLLGPGDVVLTAVPCWPPYDLLCRAAGCVLQTFPMFDEQQRFSTAALEEALAALRRSGKRGLLLLNDPCHNPTGYSMSSADWESTLALLHRHGREAECALVVDAAYMRFHPHGLGAVLLHQNSLLGAGPVIFAWSASKSFTYYGLRVGAAVAIAGTASVRQQLELRMNAVATGTWGACNRSGMLAVADLLQDEHERACYESEVEAAAALLRRRGSAYLDGLRAHGLGAGGYQGGFFATLACAEPAKAAAALRAEGIYLVPISNGLRIALCSLPTDQLQSVIAAAAPLCSEGMQPHARTQALCSNV